MTGDRRAPALRYLSLVIGAITLLGVISYPVVESASPRDAPVAITPPNSQEGRVIISEDFSSDVFSSSVPTPLWVQTQGTWGVVENEAVLASGQPTGAPSYATVEVGTGDLRISARVTAPEVGWGLVFRFANPLHYAYATINPGFAAVNIGLVRGVDDILLRVLGPAPMLPGEEIGVTISGNLIFVSIDGREIGRVAIPPGTTGTRAGLMGLAPAVGTARWDDVRIEKFDA